MQKRTLRDLRAGDRYLNQSKYLVVQDARECPSTCNYYGIIPGGWEVLVQSVDGGPESEFKAHAAPDFEVTLLPPE